jgi:hypothetical protein
VNLSQARGALVDRGFDYLSGAQMNLMLNRARNDFEDSWDWPWLRETQTGTPPLAISDLKHVLLVTASNYGELLNLDASIAAAGSDVTLSGFPSYWYMTDSSGPDETVTIHTLPAATTPITVSYVRATPELTGDTDVPAIPARFHSVWIDWAVIQAYKDSDNFSAASALQGDVNARMNVLIERYETRNRQHSQMMSIRSASEDD